MKGTLYFRSLIAGALVAAALSLLSFLGMSRVADQGASQHRAEFLNFLAETVERKVSNLPIDEIRALPNTELFDPGPLPFGPQGRHGPPGRGGFELGPGGPPPPPEMGGLPPPPHPPRGPRFDFWIVSADGTIVAQRASEADLHWDRLAKPSSPDVLQATEDFFRIRPGYYVTKLRHEPTLYLVMREARRPFAGPLLATQALITFATVLAALVFSLSFTFFYLRRKSAEARAVLLRLERGDLKARFEIAKFDEFGSLLLDFNRMADEIERLVSRLVAVESSRKGLLQELGHDLRTPLTSLTTSFDTYRQHFAKMNEEQRTDMGNVISAEIEYITELIEKLMEIASLDNPHYKGSTEVVDVGELLSSEIRARQTNSSDRLKWTLRESGSPARLVGDGHLILRLFRNAFDNASRFAQTAINVRIETDGRMIRVLIDDDGPGLTPAELESFAKRREQRARREGPRPYYSLGLGSVIMKTIAELHEGQVEIRNRPDGGAEVTVSLPTART